MVPSPKCSVMTILNTILYSIDIITFFLTNYLDPGSHAHMGLPHKDPLALDITYIIPLIHNLYTLLIILSLTILYNGPYSPYTNHNNTNHNNTNHNYIEYL